jgi:isopenicillin-N N-acyltransferase-like protein
MVMPMTGARSNPIPLIAVGGSHLEIGRQIGESCAEKIRLHVENTRNLIEASYDILELSWEGAQIQARKYIPFAEERYPLYVDEIRGIAEGAGVSFDAVAVINALEAVTMDALHLSKCTTFAVNDKHTANGHVLVAHNEDWLPEDEDCVYLVHVSPNDEPPFLAMTYGGLIPNIGFNAYGIAQCCDTVYPNDSRIGIPRVIVSRAVLAAKTPGDAIRKALIPRRAAGYNHILAHESGEIYSVEVSARRFAILYADDGYLVHTNHYLDSSMREIEDEPDELIETRIRYFRALRLLKDMDLHTIHSLQAIQKDHVNFPNSVCNHIAESVKPLDREKTINALVIDLSTRSLCIAWGNPCIHPYNTYYLNA